MELPFRLMQGMASMDLFCGAHLLTGSCPSTRGYPAGVRTAAYDSAKQRMSVIDVGDRVRVDGDRGAITLIDALNRLNPPPQSP